MHKSLLVLPLALLAACGTPQERCISQANSQVRVLDRLISETQGNLSGGYALEEQQEVRVINTTCTGQNEDGTTFVFPCEDTQTRTRRVPVAIDLNAEQAKLNSLLQRREQEAAAAQARAQQCVVQYPE